LVRSTWFFIKGILCANSQLEAVMMMRATHHDICGFRLLLLYPHCNGQQKTPPAVTLQDARVHRKPSRTNAAQTRLAIKQYLQYINKNPTPEGPVLG